MYNNNHGSSPRGLLTEQRVAYDIYQERVQRSLDAQKMARMNPEKQEKPMFAKRLQLAWTAVINLLIRQ